MENRYLRKASNGKSRDKTNKQIQSTGKKPIKLQEAIINIHREVGEDAMFMKKEQDTIKNIQRTKLKVWHRNKLWRRV